MEQRCNAFTIPPRPADSLLRPSGCQVTVYPLFAVAGFLVYLLDIILCRCVTVSVFAASIPILSNADSLQLFREFHTALPGCQVTVYPLFTATVSLVCLLILFFLNAPPVLDPLLKFQYQNIAGVVG